MSGPFQPLIQLTRLLSVRYTITFLISEFVCVGLACLGLSATVTGVLRWLLWGTGIAAVVFAGWLTKDTSRRRPELLRSEDHQTVSAYLDWLQTTDMEDQDKIAAAEVSIAALLGKPKALKSEARGFRDEEGDERDG